MGSIAPGMLSLLFTIFYLNSSVLPLLPGGQHFLTPKAFTVNFHQEYESLGYYELLFLLLPISPHHLIQRQKS